MSVRMTFAVLLTLAATVRAESLRFWNDTRATVVVQTGTLVRGKVRSDSPLVLKPGEWSAKVPLDGDKVITVYDGRSNRILFQTLQSAGPVPLAFRILPDTHPSGKVRLLLYRKGP